MLDNQANCDKQIKNNVITFVFDFMFENRFHNVDCDFKELIWENDNKSNKSKKC